MKTGCAKCDKVQAETNSNIRMCPEHELEELKWFAEVAQQDYQEAKQKYEQEFEREQNANRR